MRIMRRSHFSAGALALALTTGCGDELVPNASPPTGTVCESSFAITDDTNYTMTSSLSVELARLKDASDVVFDWSAVTVNYFGRPIDPLIDIDNVVISLWGMTPEELEENLRQDNLPLGSNKGAITTYPGDAYTSMNLLGFNVFGSPLPEEELWPRFDTMHPEYQYPQDTHTYMVTAGSGTAAGKGTRMLTLFNLDPASDQTELFLTNESTELDFTVTLGGAHPGAGSSRHAVARHRLAADDDERHRQRILTGSDRAPSSAFRDRIAGGSRGRVLEPRGPRDRLVGGRREGGREHRARDTGRRRHQSLPRHRRLGHVDGRPLLHGELQPPRTVVDHLLEPCD